jgi:capsid protein
MAVRDASELLWPAVAETLSQLDDLTAADAGAAKLAAVYAKTIDQCDNRDWAVRWIGPLLLDALTQLGATPAARAAITKKGPAADGEDPLSRLRARRRGA